MAPIKIDKIVRSGRRTLGLEVTRDARLIVRAPLRISLGDIEKIVFEKRAWIENKQKIAREKRLKSAPVRFTDREEFLYLGDSYPLLIVENADTSLSFNKGFWLMRKYLPSAKKLFINWYRKEAYRKIKERVGLYSDLMRLKYSKFGISNARRRWGSCNSKGNIHISWRLIMAPLRIIDYVVVHELVHLTEKNHSKKFWNKLGIIRPDYKKSRRWLKENGHLFVIERQDVFESKSSPPIRNPIFRRVR